MQSRSAAGAPVCTAGDAYRVEVVSGGKAPRIRFSALSVSVKGGLYWLPTPQASLPGTNEYELTVVLVSTQRRERQRREGRPSLRFSPSGESPLVHFLRDWQCVWAPLRGGRLVRAATGPPASPQPPCSGGSAATSGAYFVALGLGEPCGRWCRGSPTRRLLDTSSAKRLAHRRRNGVAAPLVLRPSSCRYNLLAGDEVASCLANTSVLNVGSSLAADLSKGFARLNAADLALARSDSRVERSRFWESFERYTSLGEVSPGSRFPGGGSVRSTFIHLPFYNGLGNIFPSRAAEFGELMCAHDVVVFESGMHDLALPSSRYYAPAAPTVTNALMRVCAESDDMRECEAVSSRALGGQSWREFPLKTYRERLQALTRLWRGCRERRERAGLAFRPLFKLAPAPRTRNVSDFGCDVLQTGYNGQAHHVLVANEVARRVVEGAGFEVFDAFPLTLHADGAWFDRLRMAGFNQSRFVARARRLGLTWHGLADVSHVEALSDMATQMLLGMLCTAQETGTRRAHRAAARGARTRPPGPRGRRD